MPITSVPTSKPVNCNYFPTAFGPTWQHCSAHRFQMKWIIFYKIYLSAWYCRDRASSCNIYAVQQDTQNVSMSEFYSALMLALHVSDLIGPSSGAYYSTRPAVTKVPKRYLSSDALSLKENSVIYWMGIFHGSYKKNYYYGMWRLLSW